mgnify:CR=1 FL=1
MPEKPKKVNNKTIKKPIIKDKPDEIITSKYKYKPGKNDELIVDKPSTPLILNNKKDEKVIVKSNKELYESYIKDLNNFSLSINGEIMYDSSIDKSNITPLYFDNDFFVLYGKKYSYNGLRIQKIN